MSRLPNTTRLPEKYSQFFDDYRLANPENMEEIILAYGDTITLFKKEGTRTVDIDTSGLESKRGRLGGRRKDEVVYPKSIPTLWKRPQDNFGVSIPAIVELTPSLERREMFGISDAGTAIATLSTKWLLDRQIVIDNAQDLFLYKNRKFKINSPDITGLFLNSEALNIYTLEKL